MRYFVSKINVNTTNPETQIFSVIKASPLDNKTPFRKVSLREVFLISQCVFNLTCLVSGFNAGHYDHFLTLRPNIFFVSQKVYGGGHFKSNSRLNITTHHLLAIFSGGKLSHNHAGYKTKEGRTGTKYEASEGPGQGTGNVGGASGAGHAGTGGRGDKTDRVGQFYGSLYRPWSYGSVGGFGRHYGKFPRCYCSY